MLPKEDREIISKIGRYNYNKMKQLNMTLEEFQEYQQKIQTERKFKKQIGYRKYEELKQLGMTLEQYKNFKEETKYRNRQKYEEKSKIRFRTIRYIERYCDLEMKCQICGTREDVQIHHPNYNDYLKINLLCRKHHTQLHNFELVPPEIIDLEKETTKKPVTQERKEKIEKQLESMKNDVFKNNFTYHNLSKKYKLGAETIKRRLKQEENWEDIKSKLKKNAKRKQSEKKRKVNSNSPFLEYQEKNGWTLLEISNITGIPFSTINAISNGKLKIENIKEKTKQKLLKLTTTDTNLKIL